MGEMVKQMLVRPIQLADQVTKAASEASSFKSECSDLKSKTEKLSSLLRQLARAGSDLYDRPAHRILNEAQQSLEKALSLSLKCRATGPLQRLFTLLPAAAFRKSSSQLDNSIGDLSWLLCVSSSSSEDDFLGLGLPPVASNEPILCFIWEKIALLHSGSPLSRPEAASSLVALARDNLRYGSLIIQEGGLPPLLRLLMDGSFDGQESAAEAIGLLARDPESVEQMVIAGVCSVFAKVLKDSPMKVQAMVAWALSLLVHSYPNCQDLFAQNGTIRLLVSLLAFETIQEHSRYAVVSGRVVSSMKNPGPHGGDPANHIYNVVTNMISQTNEQKNPNHYNYSLQQQQQGRRAGEDEETKGRAKAMAARALWFLAKGNAGVCRIITESRAMLCFAVLMEKGGEGVKYNSAMAVMEITAVAERETGLRRAAFKPSSPACRAVVEQMVRVLEEGEMLLLLPCVRSVGNLARTFRATETRLIRPLVRLLEEEGGDGGEVTREAAIALCKFAEEGNYLHVDHCKVMVEAGGGRHLVQLVYLGENDVQVSALMLLAYIAMHVPESEELAEAEVLPVLEWASKQGQLVQEEKVELLLREARSRLELYQSRASSSKPYHS